MLRQSFIFLDKIGETTEQKLWNHGINTWDDFLATQTLPSIRGSRKTLYQMQIKRAEHALEHADYTYFIKHMPQAHLFRLYPHLRDQAVFLDIETTGYYGDITVIGLYDGENVMSMVRGFNLDKEIFLQALNQYNMIITFNGSSFDLPIICKYFNITLPQVHIDLRHVCSRIGLTGGLKAIEKKIGIHRPDEITGINGADAVALWQAWKHTNNQKYLDLIIQYNQADIINLKPLAEHCIKNLWSKIRGC